MQGLNKCESNPYIYIYVFPVLRTYLAPSLIESISVALCRRVYVKCVKTRSYMSSSAAARTPSPSDNKLMKMSLAHTSISPFQKRSTEHINIAADTHSVLSLSGLIQAIPQLPAHIFLAPSAHVLHACPHSQFEPHTLVWLSVEPGLCHALNDLLLYLDTREPRPCEARNRRGVNGCQDSQSRSISSGGLPKRSTSSPYHRPNGNVSERQKRFFLSIMR